MKTESNSMLMKWLQKQIVDVRSDLAIKEDSYNTALTADEPFKKLKALRAQIKTLKNSLKGLEAQEIISVQLSDNSN
jgi:hypothetical protein